MKKILIYSTFLLVLIISSMTAGVVAKLTVTTVNDLNQDGVVVAVQSGTTSDLFAQSNLTKATINEFDSFDAAVQAVVQKDAHVLLGDLPVLAYYAVENASQGVKVVGSFGSEELFGIGVRQADTEFKNALDAALYTIINDGTYDKIYSDWFSGSVVLTDDSTTSTATTFPANTTDSTLTKVLNAGKIAFGSDTTYPPFEFLDGGNVVGFDADIAAAVAKAFATHYGVAVSAVMQTNDWDPIIPDLKAGKFDAILSAMTKTDERAQVISFTRSYYTSKQGILQGEKDFTPATTSANSLPIPIVPLFFAVMAIPIIRKIRRY